MYTFCVGRDNIIVVAQLRHNKTIPVVLNDCVPAVTDRQSTRRGMTKENRFIVPSLHMSHTRNGNGNQVLQNTVLQNVQNSILFCIYYPPLSVPTAKC